MESELTPSNPNGTLKTATTDQQHREIVHAIKLSKSPAVVNYGASWYVVDSLRRCRVCSQILPAFSKMSKEFPKLTFVYADIDECPDTTQDIRYTPTFRFFRDGERVDEMYGAGDERLRDRLWLHS